MSLPGEAVSEQIAGVVARYKEQYPLYEAFEKQIRGVAEYGELRPLVHSLKTRIKDPEHLREKLERKASKAAAGGPDFDITLDNYPTRITDLVGARVLHLHTRQIERIHPILVRLFADSGLGLVESFARTWDIESRELFTALGIATQDSPSFYTSVHYVVSTMNPVQPRTAEFQVRTLAEEIWGEVDHAINYPTRSRLLSCREQLMALARVTSSCSRLVDSIFATHADGSSNVS